MAHTPPKVNTVSWPPADIDAITASLSADRFQTYLDASGNDKIAALRLYAWNTAASGAFYAALQLLEVAMRNAFHRELTAVYGAAWYDNPATGLDNRASELVDASKRQLRRDGKAVDPPHMIANLSFGFWVSLLGKGGRLGRAKANYEMTLWRPALRKAFPASAKLDRKRAHMPIDYLRIFRNRIAHHEPVFSRHLQADFDSIVNYTAWLCEPTSVWLVDASRVPEILADKANTNFIKF